MLTYDDIDRIEKQGAAHGEFDQLIEQAKSAIGAAAGLDECAKVERRYGAELDAICELLETAHPIGVVKAIGRLEAAQALREVLQLKKAD